MCQSIFFRMNDTGTQRSKIYMIFFLLYFREDNIRSNKNRLRRDLCNLCRLLPSMNLYSAIAATGALKFYYRTIGYYSTVRNDIIYRLAIAIVALITNPFDEFRITTIIAFFNYFHLFLFISLNSFSL